VVPILSQRSVVDALASYIPSVNFCIILHSKLSLPFSFSDKNFVYICQYCGLFRVCNHFLSQLTTHDSQLPTTKCLGRPSCLQNNPWPRTTVKTHRGIVFIEPLPRNGYPNTAVLLLRNLATDCLPRACLRDSSFSISLPSNIHPIVECAYARRYLSCRCLAIHVILRLCVLHSLNNSSSYDHNNI
jgi:hypothetical protein